MRLDKTASVSGRVVRGPWELKKEDAGVSRRTKSPVVYTAPLGLHVRPPLHDDGSWLLVLAKLYVAAGFFFGSLIFRFQVPSSSSCAFEILCCRLMMLERGQ